MHKTNGGNMKKNVIVAFLLLLLSAGLIAAGGENSAVNPAYNFSLKALNGKIIRLSDYKGKVVILDFWATWCPPCRVEIPSFVKLYNKYHKQGLVIIGAAVDDRARVEQFVEDYGVTYPVVIADQASIDGFGGIRGLPTTFVIDKNGNIINNYTGFTPEEEFLSDFQQNK
jgi:peroxiredoxin